MGNGYSYQRLSNGHHQLPTGRATVNSMIGFILKSPSYFSNTCILHIVLIIIIIIILAKLVYLNHLYLLNHFISVYLESKCCAVFWGHQFHGFILELLSLERDSIRLSEIRWRLFIGVKLGIWVFQPGSISL